MKKIKLTQNKYALVDDSDFEYLNQFKWYAHKQKKAFYAIRHSRRDKNGKQKTIRMHSIIMGKYPIGKEVDHIDGNSLNNQRSNLRFATRQQNIRNQKKGCMNTSGFKGVHKYKHYEKWIANARLNGQKVYLGFFNSPIEAYKTYCKFIKKYYGEFARIS